MVKKKKMGLEEFLEMTGLTLKEMLEQGEVHAVSGHTDEENLDPMFVAAELFKFYHETFGQQRTFSSGEAVVFSVPGKTMAFRHQTRPMVFVEYLAKPVPGPSLVNMESLGAPLAGLTFDCTVLSYYRHGDGDVHIVAHVMDSRILKPWEPSKMAGALLS